MPFREWTRGLLSYLHRREIERTEGIVKGVGTEKVGKRRELLGRETEVGNESGTEMCGTEMTSLAKGRYSLQLKKLSLGFMEGSWMQNCPIRSLMKMRRDQAQ
jgi:hypothetical protein